MAKEHFIYKVSGSNMLGSVQRVEVLYRDEPSSVSITVKDPNGTVKVDDASMTVTSSLATYEYNNLDESNPGSFLFLITAVFESTEESILSFEKELFNPDPFV